MIAIKYSRTSPYGYLSNTDTSLIQTPLYSLIRTVHLVPGKCPYILRKNNLYNTDNEISAAKRNSYKLNLFITDAPMMTVIIQHDFLVAVRCQSVINCLIVHTINKNFHKYSTVCECSLPLLLFYDVTVWKL